MGFSVMLQPGDPARPHHPRSGPRRSLARTGPGMFEQSLWGSQAGFSLSRSGGRMDVANAGRDVSYLTQVERLLGKSSRSAYGNETHTG